MATAKKDSPTSTSKLRIAGYVLILFLVILGAVFAWNYNFIKGQLAVGTAYGARVACSCHYIGGRDIGDCRKDFEPGMELIGLSVDDESRQVTASVPLLSSATAEFREGWGCVMADRVKLDVD
ncbi:MAG: hypothetical protein AAF067_00060 [Pseudomonadota bacterium]